MNHAGARLNLFVYNGLRNVAPKLTSNEPPENLPSLFLRHKAQEEAAAAKLTRFDRKLRWRPQRDVARTLLSITELQLEAIKESGPQTYIIQQLERMVV